MTRRDFLRSSAGALAPLAAGALQRGRPTPAVKIALNQWSLFTGYVGDTSAADWWDVYPRLLVSDPAKVLKGPLDPIDFPRLTREGLRSGRDRDRSVVVLRARRRPRLLQGVQAAL